MLSPGVFVAEGAIVRDSVILSDTVIGPGAVVDRCIIDKNVVIGAGAHVGDGDDNTPNKVMPEEINTGITLVGKGSIVPEGYSLGRNVVVHAHAGEDAYKRKKVASGQDVGKAARERRSGQVYIFQEARSFLEVIKYTRCYGAIESLAR